MKKLIFFFIIVLLIPRYCYALCGSSSSCVLIDNGSGRVLYSKNKDQKRLIASTTKLMTFLIAYENGNLNKKIKAKEEILKMYGTSIYLSLNEEMILRDMLYGLILRSGNDVSEVIANNIGNSYEEFISMMNSKAKELGMENTTFFNPHGLDEETENYSTSYDMGLLARHLSNIPFYLEVSSTKHYVTSTSLKAYDWYNRNKLLSQYKYAISGKNGYTPKAGKTLVSGAMKGNLSLSAVSLNDSDIYNTHVSLYEYGFNNYENYMILNKDNFKYEDDYYDGNYYIKNSFYYPLLESEKDNINVLIQIIRNVDLEKTNVVGNVIVSFDGKEIHRERLYIDYDFYVETESFFEKVVTFFKSIFS